MGNRLTETKCALLPCGAPVTNTYMYDIANRLTSVNGQTYTWDDNGNLLNDGTSTYTYDAANRLTSVVGGGNVSSYTYSGLGDRLSQTVNSATTNYALDLNAGLTQVLADGTNTYLYGNGRIGELQPGGFMYHLGDALGSVRQLVDEGGVVKMARSFEPYGTPLIFGSAGTGSSVFTFAGEQWDSQTNLLYLRARYLSVGTGRFITKDTFSGDPRMPLSLHRYIYAHDNPVLLRDPSGHCPWCPFIIVIAVIATAVSACGNAPTPSVAPAPQVISFDSEITGAVVLHNKTYVKTQIALGGTPGLDGWNGKWGITFKATLNIPRGADGRLEFVQNVKSKRAILTKFGNSTEEDHSGEWLLDSGVSYPIRDPLKTDSNSLNNPALYFDVAPGLSGQIVLTTLDSPGVPVDSYNTKEVRIEEDYIMFLVWRPRGSGDDERIPIGSISWGWRVHAVNADSGDKDYGDWSIMENLYYSDQAKINSNVVDKPVLGTTIQDSK